jgi:hypothetical protein
MVTIGKNRNRLTSGHCCPIWTAQKFDLKRQQASREKEGSKEGNPSTSAYKLTRKIKESAKEATRK